MGNVDQLECRLVHRGFEFLIAIPIAIRLLHDDTALEEKLLEYELDIEARKLGIARAQGDVLEIAEQGKIAIIAHRLAPLRRVMSIGHCSSGTCVGIHQCPPIEVPKCHSSTALRY